MSHHYREILKSEYSLRAKKNPSYSLRAFARDIKIPASRLSEILNGRRGLSKARAAAIASSLNFSPTLKKYFCALVESEHGRSQTSRAAAKSEMDDLMDQFKKEKISLDHLDFIAHWYHTAILELSRVKTFRSDPVWIAQALDITEQEVREALVRLEKLELIKIKNGEISEVKNFTTTGSSPPERRSEAIKTSHLGLNALARKAIEAPLSPRKGIITQIISMDLARIPDFKKKIVDFSRSLANESDLLENKQDVYCLYLQIFPLSSSEPIEE